MKRLLDDLRKGFSRKNGPRRAVLHIGLPKTGTKSIQKGLYAAREDLLRSDQRVLYPSIAYNHSLYLGMMFSETTPRLLHLRDPRVNDENTTASVREGYFSSIERDLRRTDWRTLIFSAEALCGFTPESITRLLGWLDGHVGSVRVVAYVRHPVDWTRSAVQQSLKSGKTFDEIYADLPVPRWRSRLEPWLDAVGMESFQLVSFDDARRDGDLMGSFFDAAGLPRGPLLSLAPSQHTNESMSLEAGLLLESLNRQRPLFKDGRRSPERAWKSMGRLKAIPGNRFHMSAENAERARSASRPDLKWLNDTFGVDLFPDVFLDTPLEATQPPDTMPRETVDSLAIILSDLGNRLTRLRNKNGEPSE